MFSDSIRAQVLGIILLSMGVLLWGCSVKEERKDCPCFLTLDFAAVEAGFLKENGFDSLTVAISDGNGFIEQSTIPIDGFVREYSTSVPRSGADIMAVCADGGKVEAGYGLVVEDGQPCPMVMMHAEHYSPVLTEERIPIILHKNHCAIEITMKRNNNIPVRPFRVRVDGKINGYNPDGTPKEGAFCCFSAPSSEGLCRVNVPRQKDDSFMLEVHFLDNGEIRTFTLGKYIAESGYDWNAADLEDVKVEMDFSRSGIELTVSKWMKSLSFDIKF